MAASLEAPLARAIYTMFLVSEVHPFADGIGRVARLMMNAELVAGGEERIIIPTIFRSNYLSALKALSLAQNTKPLTRTLDFAQKLGRHDPMGRAWPDTSGARSMQCIHGSSRSR